jgi:N-acetylneuraminic acid mutarotase
VNGDSLASSWYYSKAGATGGQQIGPVSWEQLLSLAQTGALTPADMVWNPQLPQWVPAGQIPGLLPAAPFAGQQGAYPAAGQPGGQWQAPPAAYYPPYQGQYSVPKKGASSWLVWVIPLIVLVLAGTGLGLYFGLRGDDGGTGGTTVTTKRTTTTAEGTTTTEEVITTVTEAPTTTTSPPAPAFWTDLNPAGDLPAARTGHAMAYDPTGRRVFLFGGWSIAESFGDTWMYEPVSNAWTKLSPAGSLPVARTGHALAYDPGTGKMIMFGGYDSAGDLDLNDTWAYDPAANTWTNLSPAGDLPSPREGVSLVYDPSTGALIMFGGYDDSGAELSDTWAFYPSTSTWANMSPASAVPSGRDRYSMVHDPASGNMILFGGWADGTMLGDTWLYDPVTNAWTEVTPAASPSARGGHRAVYDPALGRVVLFGGWDATNELSDTWAYDTAANTWTDVSPAGGAPDGRDGSSMVYDEANGKIILFGGMDEPGDRDLGDTWAYGN